MADSVFGEMENVSNMPMTVGVDPVMLICETCFSRVGQKCTEPTENGQRKVSWFHLRREDAARDLDPSRCNSALGWHVRGVCQHRA